MTGREQEPTGAPMGDAQPHSFNRMAADELDAGPEPGEADPTRPGRVWAPRLDVQARGTSREAWVRWAVAALEEE